MAVGIKSLPILHAIDGIRIGVAEAGIKKVGRRDLVVFELAEGSSTAAVFTRNAFQAAPVQVARRHLSQQQPRYLLINSGNANAGTGDTGIADTLATCEALAAATGCDVAQVLPFSTGVIGEPLPWGKICKALPDACAEMSELSWAEAAQAITTTDTVAKGASRVLNIDGQSVRVTGIAKGSGMIHPNMATMLAYIATDARVPAGILRDVLKEATRRSFNRITVDGDTSTNDACVLMATGHGPVTIEDSKGSGFAPLFRAILEIARELAMAIIRDAEGATKFITIEVEGSNSVAEGERVAFTVAQSPLVKTAFFGSDANWGRILAAVGRSDVDNLDTSKVEIFLDECQIVRDGARDPDYEDAMGQVIMARADITLRIRLHRGSSSARVWTSDLSYDYVRINAEYRT